ncbi:hypothetical protein HQ533_00240 [Candidatus Woesearchaeota archaeon]|nr:hypothetical protein [Candidatus Woesearchaeota archaeon]
MTTIGFSFTKLVAEKNKSIKGQVNIANNVTIKNVSESKLGVDSKKKTLKFEFLYTSKYEPGIGLIELGGETISLLDEKQAKDVLAQWKKEKKVSKEVAKGVMTQILAKCNVQGVVLSRDINLPPPIPLPKMK